jgi:ELWxxDGT repeat protein
MPGDDRYVPELKIVIMKKKLPLHVSHIFFVLSCFTFMLPPSAFSQVQLLKDITTSEETTHNEFSYLTNATTVSYFVSNNELWRTDGTSGGTTRLKGFKSVSSLTMVGSTVYFAADDWSTGPELWKSNGTVSGTVKVKDIYAGRTGSMPSWLTNVNGTLYFAAKTAAEGNELWKSDGTAAGTVLVKNIIANPGSSNPGYLTNLNGLLIFVVNDGQRGYEVWRSNGTANGTYIVKDINPDYRVGSLPQLLTNINGTVYFSAIDKTGGRELWKTNGTASGTVRIKDIRPGSTGSAIRNLVNVNGTLFFSANDGVTGNELWKSNGTAAGTVLVKDMNPGGAGSDNTDPYAGTPMGNFTNVNGVLYFTASRNTLNYIGRSDGTAAGTVTVQPIPTPYGESSVGGIVDPEPAFTYLNGNVYFFNGVYQDLEDENETWYYLWRMPYKGTNPVQVKAFYRTPEYYYYSENSSYRQEMIAFKGALLTYGRINSGGYELIRSDGTAAGTVTVKDTYRPTNGSWMPSMVSGPGVVYFRKFTDFGDPQELWRTDGTTAGTYMLKPTYSTYDWEMINGELWFASYESSKIYKLWRTKGTAASTVLVQTYDYPNEGFPPSPVGFTNVAGKLFYYNYLGEVWKSGGTPQTTSKIFQAPYVVHSIYAGSNGRAFIVSEDQAGSLFLHKHEGTSTTLVRQIRSGQGTRPAYSPSAVIGNILYFVANDGFHGNEVWRTDGTASGTFMLFDKDRQDPINVYKREDGIFSFAVVNNELYVSAYDPSVPTHYVIAVSDGRPNVLRSMMVPGPFIKMIQRDDKLILLGKENATQTPGVWRVDLNNQGPGASLLTYTAGVWDDVEHAIINNIVYVSNMESNKLWRTNGEACGTFEVTTGLSDHYPFAALGNSLVFDGYALRTGNEPYIYRNIASLTSSCDASTASMSTASLDQQTAVSISPYPNPFVESFQLLIEAEQGEAAEVDVYTDTGFPIESLGSLRLKESRMNVGATWPKGVYILKVKTADGVFMQRVIKR